MRKEYFLIAGCEIGVWCFYFTFRVYLKCNHRDDEYVSIFHIFLGPNFVGGVAVAQVIEWVFYQSEGSTMHVL